MPCWSFFSQGVGFDITFWPTWLAGDRSGWFCFFGGLFSSGPAMAIYYYFLMFGIYDFTKAWDGVGGIELGGEE